MNKFLEVMQTKDTFTANGAVTNSTSLNACLDLFFLAGACRRESEENIVAKLTASYVEDKIKTLKIIFWAGDIRQGAGERRFFKIALNWLNKNYQDELNKYLTYVPEFSRWDVLFELDNPKVLDYICENIKTNALLCKWLPRRKQYNGLALKIQKKMGLTPKQYRKLIVENTNVVEQKMCAKEWNNINYSQVPSVAINKYNKAWYRNDKERFEAYLGDVKSGKSKINASAIFPHDILRGVSEYSDTLNEAKIAQWNALPDYMSDGSIIPVCDVSGSMSGLPMDISVSLGLYLSERNKSCFKDAFITFSDVPKLQYLKGDINARIKQLVRADWSMNTNLTAVFALILSRAIETRLSQDDMPKTVLVISDMEFDNCANLTNYERIKDTYHINGYICPNIVFWNVNGRVGNLPVTMNDEGVALISGASPSIVRSVLDNDISPIKIMNKTIECERYSFIK